jgi:hypothetical protein
VRHTLKDLLTQRIFGLACGHPHANDADRLADDPIHKLLLGRDPVAGDPLASQPTISRFENQVGVQDLYAIGRELAASVITRHQRRLHGRARRITIDLDPTDDPTHGAQQLTFFNGHYAAGAICRCWRSSPSTTKPSSTSVRHCCARAMRRPQPGALGVLRRLLPMLRSAFPKARFLIRLDGGFVAPDIFEWLDTEPGVEYVVATAENPVLTRHAESAMGEARIQSEASGQQTEHVYTEARYAARSWPYERRVVIKAEVVRLDGRAPRDNARYVITNLRQFPRFVYEHIYCGRGDIENRIKELHDGLQIGRTSCCRFWANQFRVLLTAAAYVPI